MEERQVAETDAPAALIVKSKAPAAPADTDAQYERSYEALSQHDKNDDKDLVDFFQVKYLESQDVESVNFHQSHMDESVRANAIDESMNNEVVDQSLEHKREFIETVFDEMKVRGNTEMAASEPSVG